MVSRRMISAVLLLALAGLPLWGQQPKRAPAGSKVTRAKKLSPKQKFVLDTVRTAVALPQSSSEDRLRVLQSATAVIWPIERKMARKLSREGIRLEAEIVASGQTPPVSMLSVGNVDCAAAAQYVEAIPPEGMVRAEDSLVEAIVRCPKQVGDIARMKAETAVDKRVAPSRVLLALIERSGARSAWSQAMFQKMFSTLPTGAEQVKEAPNYAAMFSGMARKMDPDVVSKAGVEFLEWLGKLDSGGERNLALNITVDALKQALGEEKYEKALSSNVMARQAAQAAGQEGSVQPPEEETVSVLEKLGQREDRADALKDLPASLRAREAAAHGFASGTGGDKRLADRYFDVAFSAVDETWSNRSAQGNAAAVVEEVSQAAAHVDPVKALVRAQKLQDPSAQAIGMIAVARVVASSSDN